MNDVLAAARKATGVRGAGFIDTVNQRVTLQTQGQSLTPEASLPARFSFTKAARASCSGMSRASSTHPSRRSGRAHQWAAWHHADDQRAKWSQYPRCHARVAKRRCKKLRPALEAEKIQLHADLFRPANFIDTATEQRARRAALGGALVIVVLFLFLFDWRASVISSTAIPLSLLAAVLALQWMGETLNTMTLGGLGDRDRRGGR